MPPGSKAIIDQMTKLQQYTFVCASMVQYAALEVVTTNHVDMALHQSLPGRRDKMISGLKDLFEINSAAFYVFPKVPGNITSTEFVRVAPLNATS